jgi:hypothetical protein
MTNRSAQDSGSPTLVAKTLNSAVRSSKDRDTDPTGLSSIIFDEQDMLCSIGTIGLGQMTSSDLVEQLPSSLPESHPRRYSTASVNLTEPFSTEVRKQSQTAIAENTHSCDGSQKRLNSSDYHGHIGGSASSEFTRRRVFRCPYPSCSAKTFSRESDRKRHMGIHSEMSLRFPCPLTPCKRSFYRKDKLKDHLRKGHRQYQSCTCGQRGNHAEFAKTQVRAFSSD